MHAAHVGGAQASITVRQDKQVKAAIAAVPSGGWTTIQYTHAVFNEQYPLRGPTIATFGELAVVGAFMSGAAGEPGGGGSSRRHRDGIVQGTNDPHPVRSVPPTAVGCRRRQQPATPRGTDYTNSSKRFATFR